MRASRYATIHKNRRSQICHQLLVQADLSQHLSAATRRIVPASIFIVKRLLIVTRQRTYSITFRNAGQESPVSPFAK